MSRIINQIQHRDSGLTRSSESGIKVSPAILLVIVILSIIVFIYGILHFLIRFFLKRRTLASVSHSTPYQENSPTCISFPSQLQHMPRLHDSGLDQSAIDALPIFHYKDITGLTEPLDCAVCLCKFTSEDTLRLIPTCSHAFHSKCIDTWLQSTSTCPLCRTTLSSGQTMENPLFDFDGTDKEVGSVKKENGEKRLISVKLGKFRSFNNEEESCGCNLDGRRCFSIGSSQYVDGDSDLKVALFNVNADPTRGRRGESAVYGVIHGKKTSKVTGERFSVCKVWLWSKKSEVGMPMTNTTSVV